MTRTLRILHISDLHERASFDGMPESRQSQLVWDAEERGLVLGPSFYKTLRTLAQGGVDLVCFTGDLADWGNPAEYSAATRRIDRILEAVGVPRSRFFAVPGNHDVQRKIGEGARRAIRIWAERSHDPGALGRWLREVGEAPFGLEPRFRDELLERTSAFWDWLECFGRPELRPRAPRLLGYRYTFFPGALPEISVPVHVLGLDSSWLCGGDDDQGRILLTEEQVQGHVLDGEKALDGFKIALVHHPLDHLADHHAVRSQLTNGVDLLLHGHQHALATTEVRDPDGRLCVLAAGCLVEGDLGKRWPNAFQLIEVDLPSRSYTIHFRKWARDAGKRYWTLGTDLYEAAPNGILRWGPPQVAPEQVEGTASSSALDVLARAAPAAANTTLVGSFLGVGWGMALIGISVPLTLSARPQFEDLFETVVDPNEARARFLATERTSPSPPHRCDTDYVGAREGMPSTQAALLDHLHDSRGRLLVVSRGGSGKTREVAELAAEFCRRNPRPRVCIARSGSDLRLGAVSEVPVGVLDGQVLFVVDMLHARVLADAGSSPPYLERLSAFLGSVERFFPSGTQVVAIARSEPHFQKALSLDPGASEWEGFRICALPDLSPDSLVAMLGRMVARADMEVEPTEFGHLVENSDRLPETLALNVELARASGSSLRRETWRQTRGQSWAEAFRVARSRYHLADRGYQALNLLEQAGIPPRVEYVRRLGEALSGVDFTETVDGLLNHGLLSIRAGSLVPYNEEQVAQGLQAVGSPLLSLDDHFDAVVAVVAGAREPGHSAPHTAHPEDLTGLALRLIETMPRRAERVATLAIEAGAPPGNSHRIRGAAKLGCGDFAGAEEDAKRAIAYDEQDTWALLVRGAARAYLGRLNEALRDADEAVSRGRREGQALSLRGKLLLLLDREEEAEAALTLAIAAGARGGNEYWFLGWARAARGEFAQADEDMTTALELGIDASPSLGRPRGFSMTTFARFMRAFVFLKREKYADAEREFAALLREDFRGQLARYVQAQKEGDIRVLTGAKLEEVERMFGSDAVLHYFRGRALRGIGKFLEAEAELTAALEFPGPLKVSALRERARVRLELKRMGDAEQDLSEALVLDTNDPDLFRLRGAVRFDLERFWEAECDFEDALLRAPADSESMFLRGWARAKQHKLEPAHDDFSRAIELGKADFIVWTLRGAARMDRGDVVGGEADASRALESSPDDAGSLFVRGVARMRLERPLDAELDLDRCIELGKHDSDAYFARALVRVQLGKFADAESDLLETIQRGRRDTEVLRSLGQTRMKSWRAAEAEAAFDAALAQSPERADLYAQRGSARALGGNFTGAEEDLTRALALLPGKPELHYARGVALYFASQFERAARDFERSDAADAANAGWCSGLVLTRIRLGELAAAEAACSRLCERDSDDPNVSGVKGIVALARRTPAEAVLHFVPAARAGRPIWRTWLGLAYLLSGKVNEAEAAYRALIAANLPHDVFSALHELDFWTSYGWNDMKPLVRAYAEQLRARLKTHSFSHGANQAV